MGQGNEFVEKCDLSSLKVLGTVGEPINPEAWNWYNDVVGKGNCPIVDTWWQTETGGHLLTPFPVQQQPSQGLQRHPSLVFNLFCWIHNLVQKSPKPQPKACCV